MRVLVTGAAGFIGSHLSRRLAEEGHEVVGFDNLSEGTLENLAESVELVQEDLRDQEAVRRAAAGCSVIFHQAALRSVSRSIAAPGPTFDVNVRGTLNVLNAAREESARVVFASSSSVYGDQEEFPLREHQAPRPRSPYAASKLTNEVYGATWWRAYGVPSIGLRYFNVYGPGQDPASEYAAVVPRFVLACMQETPAEIHGDGEQARDFTYIDDVVEGNLLAANASEEGIGRSFNIGGGERPTSINELLDLIADLVGVHPGSTRTPPREGDVRFTQADISMARTMFGFEPRVPLAEGIRRTVEWFREREPR